ncbi:RHS repeat domain-containing protein [uncultured Tenacibaculum sp.]|uniref:RHS repeat domain-containing protein n=1 Tax=uncultured Tenacibaculum sp. TaxID=174713 RepID=UPI0026062BCE|nr:RHS repeat domain-containing protein [uncultured Tenacibaculum sp.]
MRKLSISISMLLLSVFGYGQNLPEIVPPSPSVGALMKIEQVPVSNYTGQPNINLPLVSKQVANNLAINFGLNYHTTGIKTTEKSGWVGTGWSLQGEAVISRSVVGIPDDYNDIYGGSKKVGVYHNGYFDLEWRPTGRLLLADDPAINRFLWNASGKGSGSDANEGAFDKELDIYQVNIFGKTARFVMPKEGNTLVVKMLSNSSNLKVEPIYNTSTFSISSFKVTDTMGVQYILSEKEETINIAFSGSISQGRDAVGNTSQESRTEYVSSWKATSIQRINTTELLKLEYQTVTQELELPKTYVTNKITDLGLPNASAPLEYKMIETFESEVGDFCQVCPQYNRTIALPQRTVSVLRQNLITKKLKKVTVTETGETIVFNLKSGVHPEYLSGGKILNDIEYKDGFGKSIKKVVFTYSTNSANRLFLDRYDEIFNGTGTLTHRFGYNRKSELPVYNNSDNKTTDIWGYTKADDSFKSKLLQLPTKSADPDHVTTGVLQVIHYPTGGSQVFEFESNTFSSHGDALFTNDEFKNLNPNNYDVLSKIQNMTLSGNASDAGYSQQNITITVNETTSTTLSPTITSGSQNVIDNTKFVLEKITSNGSIISSENYPVNKESSIELTPGTYRFRLFSLSLNSGTSILGITKSLPSNILAVNTRVYYKSYKSNLERFIFGGGVRIKTIHLKAEPLALESDKTINFEYKNAKNGSESSGVIDGFFTKQRAYSVNKTHIFGYYTGPVATNVLGFSAEPIVVSYDITEYLNNPYISLTQGADVGYEKVFVSELNNGYSEYEYTSAKTFPTYGQNYGYPFIPVKSKAHLHGSLVRERIFSESNKLLNEVINSYDEKEEKVTFNIFTQDKDDCAYYQFYSTYDAYLAKFPSTGREFLFDTNLSSRSGIYDNCGSEGIPVWRYFIDQYHSRYLLNKRISKSYFYPASGNAVVTTNVEDIYYNSRDLVTSTTMTNSKEEQISTTNKYAHEANNSRLISENRITTPIEVKTSKLLGLSETILSKQNTVYKDFGNGFYMPEKVQTSKGSQILEDRVVYHSYDNKGNPTEVSKKDGTSVVYIWGYNQTQPIAKIEGATLSTIPSATITNLQTLSNNDNDRSINTTGSEGALRVALNNLRNLTALKDALVTTFTYDPLVGVTSITDPRGETIYYEYDEFNRLKLIRNSEGHIVTEHQYNYKN